MGLRSSTADDLSSVIAGSAPAVAATPVAFILDCSFKSSVGLTAGCSRLRDLFAAKEVLGESIKECGDPPPYPDPREWARPPPKREEYIHDTTTDLWYHCCEHRPYGGKFAIDAEAPHLQRSKGMLDSMKQYVGLSHDQEEDIFSRPYERPKGPLLQCNLMENLKHRQDSDGGREVVDKISKSTLGSLTGFGGHLCKGDQAVALQRYAGGTKFELLADDLGQCVDTGPPGATTPLGKPYHVFELKSPADAALLGCMQQVQDKTPHAAACRMRPYWSKQHSHFL